ncbi:MAG: DUF4835 family protein [Bacteroidia bacterium]|nr:DUF4835 family protein [Bacteroidia bacterium]
MHRILSILGLLFILSGTAQAQELNCKVQVLSQAIQLSDKRVFTTLETAIREFMNNTRWTNDQFKRDERIECNLTFNIKTYTQPDQFSGTLQLQVRRPTYNTNYGTLLLNLMDQDISFRYLEYQPIEFSESAYVSGLASLLGYYAFVVLAIDYDSFSPEGGSAYWQKAQQVVNNAIQDPAKGWKATDVPPRNRYWLVENYLNPIFEPLREANYKYHRLGMDVMYNKSEQGRAQITQALEGLMEIHKDRPSSYNMQVFFNTKADELVNIYQQASPQEKAKVLELLAIMDPTNSNKYKKINGQ